MCNLSNLQQCNLHERLTNVQFLKWGQIKIKYWFVYLNKHLIKGAQELDNFDQYLT